MNTASGPHSAAVRIGRPRLVVADLRDPENRAIRAPFDHELNGIAAGRGEHPDLVTGGGGERSNAVASHSEDAAGSSSGRGAAATVASWFDARPNPFTGTTTIRFTLGAPSWSEVTLHDVSGRRVRTVIEQTLPAGEHAFAWDGYDDMGRPAATGTYLCRLQTGGGVRTIKVHRVR